MSSFQLVTYRSLDFVYHAGPSKRGRGAAGGKVVFECTMCGKACSQSSHLTVHMRTHSGDRPYACITCGQAFSRAHSLTVHMHTHSGNRPYPCTTCDALRKRARSRSGMMALNVRRGRVLSPLTGLRPELRWSSPSRAEIAGGTVL
jgi:DNA-directed RNA polymerase subunit RPC12/RpoP